MKAFLKFIDKLSELIAKLSAWLIILLTFALFYEAISRYLFNAPTLWAYDLSYMLYATIFLLGAAYVLSLERHVKVTLISDYFSPRVKAIVNIILYLILFFPAITILFIKGIDFAAFSWRIREVSATGTWRPPIYPLKTVLPVAMGLLLLQGIAQFIRSIYVLLGKEIDNGS